jgi:hypothetical protein
MHRLFVPEPLKAQRNFDFAGGRVRLRATGDHAPNAAAMLQHFLTSLLMETALQKPNMLRHPAAGRHYS